jgi:hypothetical protein
MRKNKIEEQKELIKDLSAIIVACNSAIQVCTNQHDYDSLKKELVITYEERERQYKRLDNMVKE